MRNVCLAITLEYIINTVDIKQTDSPGYLPPFLTVTLLTFTSLLNSIPESLLKQPYRPYWVRRSCIIPDKTTFVKGNSFM